MYIYLNTYIHVCMYVYIYMYAYLYIVILVYRCNNQVSNVFLSIQFHTNVSQLVRRVLPGSYAPLASFGELSSNSLNRLSVCLSCLFWLWISLVCTVGMYCASGVSVCLWFQREKVGFTVFFPKKWPNILIYVHVTIKPRNDISHSHSHLLLFFFLSVCLSSHTYTLGQTSIFRIFSWCWSSARSLLHGNHIELCRICWVPPGNLFIRRQWFGNYTESVKDFWCTLTDWIHCQTWANTFSKKSSSHTTWWTPIPPISHVDVCCQHVSDFC